MDCDYIIKDLSTHSIVQRAMAHHLKDHEGIIYDATDNMTKDELENKIKLAIRDLG